MGFQIIINANMCQPIPLGGKSVIPKTASPISSKHYLKANLMILGIGNIMRYQNLCPLLLDAYNSII